MDNTSKNQEQKNVNEKGFVEKIFISPAGYHSDRASNTIYGIEENIQIKDRRTGLVPLTPTFIKMAKAFQEDAFSPAGGWYLVKEQRDWLKNSIIKIVREKYEKDGISKIDILEAGVASFNHHFSYLMILQEAINELKYPDLIFRVTATDKAFYPLFCIDEINAVTFDSICEEKELTVLNEKIPIHDSFIDIIKSTGILNFDQIKVRTKQYDLTDNVNIAQLGSFDIITEHFITSVIDSFHIVSHIRSTYSKLLRKGGFLLDASGITPHIHADRFDEFLDIHKEHGLIQYSGMMNVWDPYGMRTDDILKLLKGQPVETSLDNGLYIFKKD